MASPSPANSQRHDAPPSAGGRRHPRNGKRVPPSRASAQAPDPAAAAREAVVSFLHDASAATAERKASQAAGAVAEATSATATATGNATRRGASGADGAFATAEDSIPWSAASAPSPVVDESAVVRAAAVGVSTLERIELIAARVDADIAAALQAHAELQAGAGAAAEAAVRAAQEAWEAAGTAVDADIRAKISLRKIAHYVAFTTALVIIAIVILALAATYAH